MDGMKSIKLGGKLAAAAVVAGLIVGPASADAKTICPSAQAASSSHYVVTETTAINYIPQSVETGRKVH
jgi:hypothetical protein